MYMYVCMFTYINTWSHKDTHIFINDQATNKTAMLLLKFVFFFI